LKGWTCPKEIDGRRTEDYWRSHQVPMGKMHEKPEHVHILEEWMQRYRPAELFDENGRLRPELAELPPRGEPRMSANPHTNGGLLLRDLRMPDFRDYAVQVSAPGAVAAESKANPTRCARRYLRTATITVASPTSPRIWKRISGCWRSTPTRRRGPERPS